VTVRTRPKRDGPVLAAGRHRYSVGDTQVYSQDLDKANAEADAVVRRNLESAR